MVLPRRSSSRGRWRGRAREALLVSGKRCPQAAVDAAIPRQTLSLALRPCGAGSRALGTRRLREPPLPRLPQGRCRISSAPALPYRSRSPPRPSSLRRARGLSSGLSRGSCARVPSGPLPTCPRALPVTSWKHPLPCPAPAGGRGQRGLLPLAGAAVTRARRSRRRSRSWALPRRRRERSARTGALRWRLSLLPGSCFLLSLPSSVLPAGRRCPGAMAGP